MWKKKLYFLPVDVVEEVKVLVVVPQKDWAPQRSIQKAYIESLANCSHSPSP